MKRTSKILFSALAIMLLVGCDFKNKETKDNDTTPKENVTVETYTETSLSTGNLLPVSAPQITSIKSGAKAINKKMLEKIILNAASISSSYDLCQTEQNSDKQNENYDCEKSYIKYDYEIKNDIIAIDIETVHSYWPASGDGHFNDNYFYDIKNDKELSLKEALPLMGYTINDLKQLNYTSFDQLVETECSDAKYIIKNGKGTISAVDYNVAKNGCA